MCVDCTDFLSLLSSTLITFCAATISSILACTQMIWPVGTPGQCPSPRGLHTVSHTALRHISLAAHNRLHVLPPPQACHKVQPECSSCLCGCRPSHICGADTAGSQRSGRGVGACRRASDAGHCTSGQAAEAAALQRPSFPGLHMHF